MDNGWYSDALAWLGQYPVALLWTVAITALLESLAIVGLIMPGIAILFTLGLIAGSLNMPLLAVLAAACVGAILGDLISFLLGRHFKHAIPGWPPFRSHPDWITRGERFFQQYGLISIVMGRFIGPLRPIMPLVAGMLGMRPSRFTAVDVLSALAWAPLYILPGYFAGSTLDAESTFNHRHLMLLLTLILPAWLAAQAMWFYHYRLIQRPRARLTAGLTCLATGVGFFAVQPLFNQFDNLTKLNHQLAETLHNLRHDWLDTFFIGVSALGYQTPMVIWAMLITLALLIRQNYYLASVWVSATLLGRQLTLLLKDGFAIPRPDLVIQPPESAAYPSGHTSMTTLFTGLLVIMLLPRLSFTYQKTLLTGAFIFITLVAGSRMYLGVHWLSDILGGVLLGWCVCLAVYLLFSYRPFQPPQPRDLLLTTFAALLISLAVDVIPHWSAHIQRYQPALM